MIRRPSFVKNTVEKKKYTFDYSGWLDAAETITSPATLVSPLTDSPLTISGAFVTDGTKLSLFIAGGLTGTLYTLSIIVNTSVGQIKRDDVSVMVT